MKNTPTSLIRAHPQASLRTFFFFFNLKKTGWCKDGEEAENVAFNKYPVLDYLECLSCVKCKVRY